jgi:hypothetical protein
VAFLADYVLQLNEAGGVVRLFAAQPEDRP